MQNENIVSYTKGAVVALTRRATEKKRDGGYEVNTRRVLAKVASNGWGGLVVEYPREYFSNERGYYISMNREGVSSSDLKVARGDEEKAMFIFQCPTFFEKEDYKRECERRFKAFEESNVPAEA